MLFTVSYASLERIENDYAVCEVEQISFLESAVGDFTKECYMDNVPLTMFDETGTQPLEGHVYSVEHDGEHVVKIVRYEENETQRRIDWIRSIGKTIIN